MFGFSAKKPAESSKRTLGKGPPLMCAILLERETFPVDALLKQVAKTKFAGKTASDVQLSDGGVFSFAVDDELLALTVMPAPYPAADLEGPIATSRMWPPKSPIESIKKHRSHLLVTMIGGASDPVRRRLILTAVTALAAKQPGVMAVYWPESTLVIFPPLFVDMAAAMNTPEAPPLHLWVDVRLFRNEDGTTGAFTTGLSPLGHMEIEIPRTKMKSSELHDWLINIMLYLLENGPVLKDGETIGTTPEQKVRVHHSPSSFGHAGNVIRLEP